VHKSSMKNLALRVRCESHPFSRLKIDPRESQKSVFTSVVWQGNPYGCSDCQRAFGR
jgi:hypothetical protein